MNRKGVKKIVYRKVICTGHVIEIYEYQKEPIKNKHHENITEELPNSIQELEMYKKYKEKTNDFQTPLNKIELEEIMNELHNEGIRKLDITKKQTKEERSKHNIRRARNNIRRLALANFSHKDKFITLTFKDETWEGKGKNKFKVDWQNIEHTNQCFKTFIQRLRHYNEKRGKEKDFKYIAVIEYQDKNKRGAVHYHMLCDIEYIPQKKLQEIWGHGIIDVQRMDKKGKNGKDVDNVGSYLIYYMLKELDPRLAGKKSYLMSKNLEKPLTYTDETAENIIKHYELDKKKGVFENEYPTEYLGTCKYREYNLKREE